MLMFRARAEWLEQLEISTLFRLCWWTTRLNLLLVGMLHSLDLARICSQILGNPCMIHNYMYVVGWGDEGFYLGFFLAQSICWTGTRLSVCLLSRHTLPVAFADPRAVQPGRWASLIPIECIQYHVTNSPILASKGPALSELFPFRTCRLCRSVTWCKGVCCKSMKKPVPSPRGSGPKLGAGWGWDGLVSRRIPASGLWIEIPMSA